MRQGFPCCDPLGRVKICHGTDKIFQVCINAFPEGEWFARVFLVETIAKFLKQGHGCVLVLCEKLQKCVEAVFVGEVGHLAFDDGDGSVEAGFEFLVGDGEDDAFLYGIDALRSIMSLRKCDK